MLDDTHNTGRNKILAANNWLCSQCMHHDYSWTVRYNGQTLLSEGGGGCGGRGMRSTCRRRWRGMGTRRKKRRGVEGMRGENAYMYMYVPYRYVYLVQCLWLVLFSVCFLCTKRTDTYQGIGLHRRSLIPLRQTDNGITSSICFLVDGIQGILPGQTRVVGLMVLWWDPFPKESSPTACSTDVTCSY